jgi:hypothetical protein
MTKWEVKRPHGQNEDGFIQIEAHKLIETPSGCLRFYLPGENEAFMSYSPFGWFECVRLSPPDPAGDEGDA